MDTTLSSTSSAASSSATASGSTAIKTATDTQDRFLKLLVAQMQNQDPMNPLDNAQVTSQMAQIQTVTGIGGLNTSVQSLGTQFAQLQALQSVNMVGREVMVSGSKLGISTDADGKRSASGAYELSGNADKVTLEVLSPSGNVIDKVDLGSKGVGMQNFSWDADKAAGYDSVSYRITATRGEASVSATPYATDKVVGVNTNGATLQLKLAGLGLVDYSSIKSVN